MYRTTTLTGVVTHIRAYFDVFLLFLASPCASFRSLDLSTHFRAYSHVTLEWKFTLFILADEDSTTSHTTLDPMSNRLQLFL